MSVIASELPIEIENLRKTYGSKDALKSVSLTIQPGEIFGLLGPNGAGKTSLISILTTLEKSTSGIAKIFGNDVTLNLKETKVRVGVVPQELVNHGFFTVREVLEFQSGYFGFHNNNKRISELLERLGLAEHQKKKVLQLSGGMKRRFLIAKALVYNPQVLLLDEPTAGVDLELRLSLWSFVKELNREGLTVLLTTHYLEEAERLCDRVGVLNHGELICLEKTRDLISRMTSRNVVLRYKGEAPQVESEYLIRRGTNELVFRIPNQMGAGELVTRTGLSMNQIDDLQIKEGSLEDAMIKLLETKSEAQSEEPPEVPS